ncbi:MAG: phosphoglucosamine mutase [Bacteroidetes bacterium GWF2_41_61]|nr:MAG: phosphoglucosamine mutase [Bacteroidetes bacterium GWE2_40_15]OFY36096.1 MAG: phosphoglucosamine mutase [Bacteroidetes bacterium GWF2_41_61]HBG23753.1 phosphoglucosamine mutase [Rikenellaceae bacterium]HBZ25998.1 phosphoglucosamine mutase [Rikenellaceae bacterium]
MALIKSISGIRGTIGGESGSSFTPLDIVKFTSAYASFIKHRSGKKSRYRVVLGRDARISGEMCDHIVCGTLTACGIDVINAGLASTPTVEMAVIFERADGGIILTASHNPKEWNALKLLNERGEFLDAQDGEKLLSIVDSGIFEFSDVDNLGIITKKDFTKQHIEAVLSHPLVDTEAIYRAGFTVVLDAVNSVGGIVMPALLEAMGVTVIKINCEPDGRFPHNPEPLPEHLTQLSSTVVKSGADIGIAVDPDVDRLALINEDGNAFGEEYTLVAVADYFLKHKKGATVSNLSSSRALKEVTEAAGESHYASAVGEVNVVTEMKRVNAVIGGEGNGGVIVPDLHYGRDALIGSALILSFLAKERCTLSELKKRYPQYSISKNRIDLCEDTNIDQILAEIKKIYSQHKISEIDGLKIDFEQQRMWVHLRKSNTEPIIRIYAEAPSLDQANLLASKIMSEIKNL